MYQSDDVVDAAVLAEIVEPAEQLRVIGIGCGDDILRIGATVLLRRLDQGRADQRIAQVFVCGRNFEAQRIQRMRRRSEKGKSGHRRDSRQMNRIRFETHVFILMSLTGVDATAPILVILGQ